VKVGVGSDSFGFGLLPDVEQFVDRDDLAAGGAAASFVEAAGEQVALRAAAAGAVWWGGGGLGRPPGDTARNTMSEPARRASGCGRTGSVP
jgi:hypothetical protein